MTYSLTGPGGVKIFSTITDYLGRATLPPTGLAPGTYTVTASFAGDTTYTAATRTGTLVVSGFSGFFQPFDNPPTSTSSTPGRAVPVKFSLGGNPWTRHLRGGLSACGHGCLRLGAPTDEIETTVTADGNGLQYDPASGQYTYTWKTQKSWTGCRRLELLFVDGSLRAADFKFK